VTMQRMTGGDAVAASLAAHGVEVIFGIPGGHSLPVYDALARQKRIRHVLGRHEQGLAFMADGYYRASGKVGVLTTTSGPAVANIACGMGQATTDTSAVLAVASTVRSDLVGRNRGGLHDCGEAIQIMRPVCRHVRRAGSVQEIPRIIAELMLALRTGRPGGAFCEIPCDLLAAEAEVAIPDPKPAERLAPDASAVEAAVRLLAEAKRPVIWAGTGTVASDAGAELVQLAERIGAIVIPTILARGIVPCAAANVILADGALMTEVNDLVAEADVVLAVGTMFKQEDTAAWETRFGEKLIHVDIDPQEIGRSYPPDVAIVADAKAALQAILESLPNRGVANSEWSARAKRAEAARLAKRRAQGPTEMKVLDVFRAVVPDEAVIAADRCSLGYWIYRCMPVNRPRSFLFPMGYGGLGGSLPQAIGARIACPDRPVVCVIGDGGFQFTATELAVAVQENTPLTVVLCNNRVFGAIRANQDRNFAGRRFGVDLVNPDFHKLADAYGIDYLRADELEAFENALTSTVGGKGICLIELTVELADP